MKFRAKVIVKLKSKVKDSKGDAVSAVLKRIGLQDNANVRMGKFFELEIQADSKECAEEKLLDIINKVLVNPVVETHEILDFSEISGL